MNAIPASVRVINLAGEALPTTLVRQIYNNTNVERIYNLYGPTEDTTYSTFTLVERNAEVTIGRPIANTQAYILDANRQPVPIGVAGELYLAGEGLARGYYGRADLTQERFVPNPFSFQPGARMYRTGDLARFLPDGNIQYMGRMDNQVKLRGFRIELGDIESALCRHPQVQSAVVTVCENQGDKRLVAYVLAQPEQNVSSNELRQFLKDNIPGYMVPGVFIKLDSFPMTPNGKVNRGALPVPDWSILEGVEKVSARDELETDLVNIWQQVLGVPAV